MRDNINEECAVVIMCSALFEDLDCHEIIHFVVSRRRKSRLSHDFTLFSKAHATQSTAHIKATVVHDRVNGLVVGQLEDGRQLNKKGVELTQIEFVADMAKICLCQFARWCSDFGCTEVAGTLRHSAGERG